MKKFAFVFMIISLVIVFPIHKISAQSEEISSVYFIGANIDTKGVRLNGMGGFYTTKPLFGFARFGVGLEFLSLYLDYRIPDLEFSDPLYPAWNLPSIKHGYPLALLPVRLYFVPVTWGQDDDVVKSVYFYYEYWPITGGTEGNRCADPQPSTFTEYGMCISPFGKFLSFSIFHRNLVIPEGEVYINKTDYTQTASIDYIGGTVSFRYYFPGYWENYWGISINLFLGGMSY